MGFVATEAVERLDYDFNPHINEKGTIPEPTTEMVEAFRNHIFGAVRASGIDPATLTGGKITMDNMDELLGKAKGVEEEMLVAVSDLTGISQQTLRRLPHRISAAFMGWIMGQFFSPEA